tara:strand:- start:58 stop:762 length:705 start_codon:yes stop_codon:yes gene_type:complete
MTKKKNKVKIDDLFKSLHQYNSLLDNRIKVISGRTSKKSKIEKELLEGKKEEILKIFNTINPLVKYEEAHHVDLSWEKIIKIFNDVFDSIKDSRHLKELVWSIHDFYYYDLEDAIGPDYHFIDYTSSEDPNDNDIDYNAPHIATSIEQYMYNTNGGDCPKCGSRTIMIRGDNNYFFGCSTYYETGCKGTLRLKKGDYEDLLMFIVLFEEQKEYYQAGNDQDDFNEMVGPEFWDS